MHLVFDRLRAQYGDLYRLSMPGMGKAVVTFRPEDVQTVYAADGRIPVIPGFDIPGRIRQFMPERYK